MFVLVNTLSNKFIVIEETQQYFQQFIIKHDCNINILDLSLSADINIQFINQSGCKVHINFVSISINNKKRINLDCIFASSNNFFSLNSSCLSSNHSIIDIMVNGYMKKDYNNNHIDINIEGITNDQSQIKVCPVFDFITNKVTAKHAINIGSINLSELNFLMSRGIKKQSAKYMLLDSKLNICFVNNNSKKASIYKEKLFNIWNNINEEQKGENYGNK